MSNNIQPEYLWIIGFAAVVLAIIYFIELFRYKGLFRRAKSAPFIAPITVKGKTVKEIDSRQANLILRAHISEIREIYEKTAGAYGTLYGEISEVTKFSVFSGLGSPPDYTLEVKYPIKIGPLEFYVKDVANLFLWVFRALIPYARTFMKLQFYVTLICFEDEIQLTVARQLLDEVHSDGTASPRGSALTTIKDANGKKRLSSISALLRDSIYMIFQLFRGADIPGRKWYGMKNFTEGLEMLELYSRTENPEALDKAIRSFRKAAMADNANYDVLYIEGYLLLFQRTEESINKAIMPLTQALKSKNHWLKALVHAALTNCYAQQVHRLAKQKAMLNIAQTHVDEARKELESAKRTSQDLMKETYVESRVASAAALVELLRASNVADREKSKEGFTKAARKYNSAIKNDAYNTSFHNALGWIYLQFAEWGPETELRPEERIVHRNKKNPAEVAELCFKQALTIDPGNKLVHANLCRLYASKWYRDKDYLDLCRKFGYTAVRLDPDYTNGYLDLALSLIKYNEIEESLQAYENALKRSFTSEKKEEIRNKVKQALKGISASQDVLERFSLTAETSS